jgi:hypothetical protein
MTIQELDRYILAVYHTVGILGWVVFIRACLVFVNLCRSNYAD